MQLVSLTPLYTLSRSTGTGQLALALALAARTSAAASEAASSTSSSSTLRTRLSAEACSSVLKMESNVLLVLHQLCPHPPRRDSLPSLVLSFFFVSFYSIILYTLPVGHFIASDSVFSVVYGSLGTF